MRIMRFAVPCITPTRPIHVGRPMLISTPGPKINTDSWHPYFKELAAAADNGDAEAQFRLGLAHIADDVPDIANNTEIMMHYFQLSATQGFAAAQSALGTCYTQGVGCKPDEKKAERYHRLAAEQGHSESQTKLSEILFGRGPAGKDEAIKWLQRAASAGNPEANFHLGCCYVHGDGVEPSAASARECFKVCAEHSDERGEYMLGVANSLIPEYHAEALAVWTKLAEKGQLDSQYALARALVEGTLGETNTEEGLRWLEKAAEAGYPTALVVYGIQLLEGNNVPADESRGAAMLERASQTGSIDGLYNFAMCCLHGRGVPVDIARAKGLLEAGAARGHASSEKKLRELAEELG